MADVFISYARSDQAMAARVAKGLQAAGFDVWWDAHLPAHRDYSEIIQGKLEDAKAVVVLWSKAAAASQWVRAEADFARNAGKLVQAQLDATLPPMPFNQIQCAALKGWRGAAGHAGWSKLRASVDSLVSGEERAAPALPGRRFLQAWPFAIAAVGLLLAAFALFWFVEGRGDDRKPVLAVMPFRSLDAQDASLVAGIWEDTRTAIGRNPQLIVLGPNTAQTLAEKGDEAARKAADYVLQASARTAGDRIRVSADLVRTKDGEQVWTQDFDRKLDDVFALQSQIASEIEGRIRGRLAEKGGTVPEHIATSGDVYALYSDARAKIRKREIDKFPAAVAQLRQVVKMDPNFAPAWASLAVAESMLAPSQKNWDLSNPAVGYARKAVDLAPNLGAAHAALAFSMGNQGPIAHAELERAIELDPSDYEALNWLAGALQAQGRKADAIEMYDRAVKIEPLFWPVVFNLYTALSDAGDQARIEKLLDFENSVGADYFASSIEMRRAWEAGDLAKAANIGLRVWATRRPEARTVIGLDLWGVLLQLDYGDKVFSGAVGPAPDFARYLWMNDPKGLEMMESHHLAPRDFLTVSPLVQNASRVYLLTGQADKLASMYRSLEMPPEKFAGLYDDPEDFLSTAPLIAVALQRSGHAADAKPLLLIAEQRGQQLLRRTGKPQNAAWLARIYAADGRKDDALSMLAGAVNRRWLPQPPFMMIDLAMDPPLASLKSDPRFEQLRQQVLGTIARERAQVSTTLLQQLGSSGTS